MRRVLVIDDDHLVRATLGVLLEHEGYEVTLAQDGSDIVNQIQTGTYDLVIADIFMPNVDGLEIVMTIQKYKPEMPVIVMSGLAESAAFGDAPDFLSMATKLGAIRKLQKPIRPSDLKEAVAACLDGK